MMLKWLKPEKFNMPRSISVILAISFLALSLTPLLISGTTGIIFSFLTQRDIVFSKQQLIGHNAADMVAQFVLEKFSAMETTARLVNPALISREEQKRILYYLLGPEPAFRQLILLNSNKKESSEASRRSQTGSAVIKDYIGNDLFAQVSRGKRYIGSVYVDKITSEPMVLMAVPVKDVFGDFQGVLIADVNLKFMWEMVGSLKVGKTGLAYVVDRQGNLIAFGDIARVLRGENLKNMAIVKEFIHSPMSMNPVAPKVFKGINGDAVLGTYVSLESPDWAVVTELPLTEAFRWVTGTIVAIGAFSLIIWGLAGWLSVSLARRIGGPVANLMKTAGRIAGGEMELQAVVEGPAEVAGLATAFNSMTAQLRENIGNLERRSHHLQITVQKYVQYMAKVARGELDSRLPIEAQADKADASLAEDPLIILGRQLNETTISLQLMFQQLQEATDNLKEREQELQVYSERLEKSNVELEQFAFIASHDLQEPLRKIQMFGAKLQDNYNQALDDKALDYLQRMNSAALRMEKLIQDLLHYSRVTTKARPFERVDLAEIIKEVVTDMEVRIQETNAEIITKNLPVIDGDPLQLRELFQNLIGNSIKYHQVNVSPVIKIQSSIIHEAENHYHQIEITDNGIGFDNVYAEKIFGLFQRLHGRNEYQGTGIGLAICRKIVTGHGGSITAKSTSGEGATFTIKLPVRGRFRAEEEEPKGAR